MSGLLRSWRDDSGMLIAKNYRSFEKFLEKHHSSSIVPISLHDCYWMEKLPNQYIDISLFVPDGMPVVFMAQLRSKKSVRRVYGPDLMNRYLSEHADKTHLLLGSKTVVRKLKKQFFGVEIFPLMHTDNLEELLSLELIKYIEIIQPDCIWIGIGSPKQVEFCYQLRKKYPKLTYFCVGAAFDFISGEKQQAPVWMQQHGLEWFFRFLTDPLKYWKRYLMYSPIGLQRLLSKKITIME